MVEHHRHERLHAGHAGGRLRIGPGLLLQRVRGVVGAEDVGGSVGDAGPDRRARCAASRTGGFICSERAEARVVVRRKRQVVRRHLDRSDVLVRGEEAHLLAGRDVQDVDERAALARDRDEPPRRGKRRFGVAPDRVARRVAGPALGKALAQAELVLRMKRGAPPRAAEDAAHAFVVGDQQVAGGGAHEHLDAGRARQALQLRELGKIFRRAAHPESVIAMHAAAGARELVGERRGVGRLRVGVGHLEHGRDAAHHRRERAGLQVLLVLAARLAEMHLRVDDAGQDSQPAGVDRLAGVGGGEIAERGDAAAGHADVARADPVMVHDAAAAQDQVEGGGHGLALRRSDRVPVRRRREKGTAGSGDPSCVAPV